MLKSTLPALLLMQVSAESRVMIAVGCYHQCKAVMMVDGAHAITCWGDNRHGQCGLDRVRYSQISSDANLPPVKVYAEGIAKIYAGCLHTCVVTKNSVTHCWGDEASIPHSGTGTSWIRSKGACRASAGESVDAFQTCVAAEGLGVETQRCWGEPDSVDDDLHSTINEVCVHNFHRATQTVTPAASTTETATSSMDHAVTPTGTAETPESTAALETSLTSTSSISAAMTTTTPTHSPTQTASHTSTDTGPPTSSPATTSTDTATPSQTSTTSPSGTATGSTSSSTTETGTPSASYTPSASIIPRVTQVVVANAHTCALLDTGRAKCWGYGGEGQLGDGRNVSCATPQDFVGLHDIGSLAAGDHHTCALLHNGSVACWGRNHRAQIGLPYASSFGVPTPYLVPDISANMVATGYAFTCVILQNRSVVCWGRNDFGQTGIGSYGTYRSISDTWAITLPMPARHITAGDAHVCAIVLDESVYCWGYNNNYEFGFASADPFRHVEPFGPLFLGDIATLHATDDATCARYRNNTARCWGYSDYGQAGYGGTADVVVSPTLRYFPDDASVAQLAAGTVRACVRFLNSTVSCWGYNVGNELGYNTSQSPRSVYEAGVLPLNVAVESIALGGLSTGEPNTPLSRGICVVTEAGRVRCWGENQQGNLGYGDFTFRPNATAVGDVPGLP